MQISESEQTSKQIPVISVLISAYNAERFIRQSVQSILDQTYRSFELLITDDGSSDNTLAILEEFRDERIRLFRQSNKGLTQSLNQMLESARGEYIARQDADDYSAPNRFDKEVEFLDANPAIALVGTWAMQVDDDNREIYRFSAETNPLTLSQLLVEENPFVHGSWLTRKSVLKELKGYREEFQCSQDYDLLLRMKENYKVSNIPVVLYYKRHTEGMISVQNVSRQRWFATLAQRCWRERADFGIDHIQQGKFELPEFDFQNETFLGTLAYRKHLVSVFSRQGDAKQTRKEIRRLLRLRWFDPFAWFQYLLSLAGGKVLKFVSHLWDSLRRE